MKFIMNKQLESFQLPENSDNDVSKKSIYTSTSKIRDFINKLIDAPNLNLLMSNGCSRYAGSVAINDVEQQSESKYKESINRFVTANQDTEYDFLKNFILPRISQFSKEDRPEVLLDKLFEIKSFIQNILNDEKIINNFSCLIEEVKKSFLEEFVLNIDYSNNNLHKRFLKRIISRADNLNKVNIFSLNYDLLIEKSAEELGVFVNNGFIGFHDRTFLPASFKTDMHIKSNEYAKRVNKSINLFKLHGSLSWFEDELKAPYGISERQVINKKGQIDDDSISGNIIIYPVQTKKRYTLDLPYSELFRNFIEELYQHNTVLIVIGYSFLDEHVNDIITKSLSNPEFNLCVFSYESLDDPKISPYLKRLENASLEDNRISIFSGKFLGDFENIINYLMPFTEQEEPEKVILRTLKNIIKSDEDSNVRQ